MTFIRKIKQFRLAIVSFFLCILCVRWSNSISSEMSSFFWGDEFHSTLPNTYNYFVILIPITIFIFACWYAFRPRKASIALFLEDFLFGVNFCILGYCSAILYKVTILKSDYSLTGEHLGALLAISFVLFQYSYKSAFKKS